MWRREVPLPAAEGVKRKHYPSSADGYELSEQIGQGTSATVFRAWCEQVNEEVAIKIVDLEWLQASLEDIWREIQVMSLSSHPNVVPYSTSFVHGHDLWVVMPLLTGGSVLSLMKCVFPDGFPEAYTQYIMYESLKALEYFHKNGQLHRDVKAANILLNSQGQAMLSDYGVMGWMVEGGLQRHMRQTFVGTPCWMAPEVMEQQHGYDYKADIWSFGITAIELAQGGAPYVNYPPMKVLLLTLQNPPPQLTGAASERYSRAYKDVVEICLQKDPRRRPNATQLLQHRFFRNVHMPEDLPDVLAKLPPLGSRGAGQANLYRQLQRNLRSGVSGMYNKPDAFSWDFGAEDDDDDDALAAPPPHAVAAPAAALSAGVAALGGGDANATGDANTVVTDGDMDKLESVPSMAVSEPGPEMQMDSDISDMLMSASVSVDDRLGSIARPGSSSTLGRLQKGRFTVSEVDLTANSGRDGVSDAVNGLPQLDASALESSSTKPRKSRFEVRSVGENAAPKPPSRSTPEPEREQFTLPRKPSRFEVYDTDSELVATTSSASIHGNDGGVGGGNGELKRTLSGAAGPAETPPVSALQMSNSWSQTPPPKVAELESPQSSRKIRPRRFEVKDVDSTWGRREGSPPVANVREHATAPKEVSVAKEIVKEGDREAAIAARVTLPAETQPSSAAAPSTKRVGRFELPEKKASTPAPASDGSGPPRKSRFEVKGVGGALETSLSATSPSTTAPNTPAPSAALSTTTHGNPINISALTPQAGVTTAPAVTATGPVKKGRFEIVDGGADRPGALDLLKLLTETVEHLLRENESLRKELQSLKAVNSSNEEK